LRTFVQFFQTFRVRITLSFLSHLGDTMSQRDKSSQDPAANAVDDGDNKADVKSIEYNVSFVF